MSDNKRNLHDFSATAFIQECADILEPGKSEAPILAPPVRQAVFQWMTELNMKKELKKVGLDPRRVLMFYGPPGTGKTTLAHHISARLGLPLVLVNMQSIVSEYLGRTGNNIDRLFAELRPQQDNCVLFLDEFDSLAKKRNSEGRGADNERNNIVIAVMQKLDTYKGTVIAATNRRDDIDPAIWRRFQMHIEIADPDAECRFAILKRYLQPMEMDDEALDILTNATASASPALLKNFAESIKRDMVLSAKLGYSNDVEAVLARAIATASPHSEAAIPPLWTDTASVADDLSKFWPPSFEKAA